MSTALAVELNRVFPLKDLINPTLFLHRGEVLIHLAGYPLIAILMMSAIDGRLLDAKLPRSYLFPIFLCWTYSTVSLMFAMHYWRIGLAAIVLMLVAGGLFPINRAPVMIGFGEKSSEEVGETTLSQADTPEDQVERRSVQENGKRRVTQVSPSTFLGALFTLVLLWLPLTYLDDFSGRGFWVWIARLGYAILGFFWFGFAASRFNDAGLPNGKGFLCLIAITTASLLPLKLNLTNGYESLAIFVLIQLPIVFLRSKPVPEKPLQQSAGSEEGEKCLRDPLEEMRSGITDKTDEVKPRRTQEVFTGISSDRAKRVPSWRRF